jgi:ABC-type polysaccharide/polyol phosphate export permease
VPRVTTSEAQVWTENRPTSGLRLPRLAELWRYRELVYYLALRDVKARYKQTALGIGWAILQPIVGVAVVTLVFRRIAHVPSDGIPYAVFALTGFLVWNYFAGIVGDATDSVVANTPLVTKVYLPRLAAPVSAVLPALVTLIPGLVVLAALMAWEHVAPGPALALLPLWVLLLLATALGTGLLLAALNVRFRDVGGALGTLIQLWLLASPVAYPASLLPAGWSWAYAINPMAGVIEAFRWSLLDGPRPGADLTVSSAVSLVLLVGGLFYFEHQERRFADVI